ncbi:MAG: hypothetical protein GEU98_14330 [Pseudonocardiaceae bacterium]|nr:hypothetical protein [Pseudonocardiaceae bacterium]
MSRRPVMRCLVAITVAGLVATPLTTPFVAGDDEPVPASRAVKVKPEQEIEPAPAPLDRLGAAISETVREAANSAVPGTEIGFAVYDRARNDTVASLGASQPFYTASVVKLLIALDVLERNDWRLPERHTRRELSRMLARSDDGIASALWVRCGGAEIIERMGDHLALGDTGPPAEPGQWGMATTSAADVITIYRFIADQLPTESGEFLLRALRKATETAADGFHQHFGIPAALPGVNWAIKQGWMIMNSAVLLHTTGLVGDDDRYVVVLLTEQPRDAGYARGRDAVTAGIGAVSSELA